MANGTKQQQGVGSFGFPSFGGPAIPQLQLRPAAINFPRPSSGGGKSKSVNPAAYIAPGLLSLLGDKFLPKPDVIEREPTGDTRKDEILSQADLIYGPEREAPTLWQELLPMGIDALAAAGFGDEGGAQYAQTAINRKIANREIQSGIAADKKQFIASKLYPNIEQVNVLEQNAARAGVLDKRIGRYYEGDPNLYVPASPKEIKNGLANSDGFRKALENENWIEAVRAGEGGSDPMSELADKKLTALAEQIDARRVVDSATVKVMTVAEPILDLAKTEYEDDGEISSTSLVANTLRLGDDVRQNFEDFAVAVGFDSGFDSFATTEEGGDAALGTVGFGRASQKLYTDILSTDPNVQIRALNRWVEEADVSDETKNMFRKEFLEDVSINNVRQKAALLQMAYLAAAANGQTGRTLSDKDLAFHLQIVGYGATQNPGVLHDNLMGFIDLLTYANDNETQLLVNPGTWGRYKFDSPNGELYSDELGYFYQPIEGKKWSDTDKLDPKNYKYRNFYDRYGTIPVTDKFSQRDFLIRKDARQGFDIYFPGRYKTRTQTRELSTPDDNLFDGLDVPLNLEDV